MEHLTEEDALYKHIGQCLKEVRTKGVIRLTQDQLASIVGLERSSIANIEGGRQKPPLHVLYALCKALNVEVSEVIPTHADLGFANRNVAIHLGDELHEIPRSVAAIVRRFS